MTAGKSRGAMTAFVAEEGGRLIVDEEGGRDVVDDNER